MQGSDHPPSGLQRRAGGTAGGVCASTGAYAPGPVLRVGARIWPLCSPEESDEVNTAAAIPGMPEVTGASSARPAYRTAFLSSRYPAMELMSAAASSGIQPSRTSAPTYTLRRVATTIPIHTATSTTNTTSERGDASEGKSAAPSSPSNVSVVRSPSDAAIGTTVRSGSHCARRAQITSAHRQVPWIAEDSDADSIATASTRKNSKYPFRSRRPRSTPGRPGVWIPRGTSAADGDADQSWWPSEKERTPAAHATIIACACSRARLPVTSTLRVRRLSSSPRFACVRTGTYRRGHTQGQVQLQVPL